MWRRSSWWSETWRSGGSSTGSASHFHWQKLNIYSEFVRWNFKLWQNVSRTVQNYSKSVRDENLTYKSAPNDLKCVLKDSKRLQNNVKLCQTLAKLLKIYLKWWKMLNSTLTNMNKKLSEWTWNFGKKWPKVLRIILNPSEIQNFTSLIGPKWFKTCPNILNMSLE